MPRPRPEEASPGRPPRSRPGTRRVWRTRCSILRPRALESIISPDLGRTPSLFDQRSPAVWATHINVPVFLVGALEDEQVGPQWPALITALQGDKNVYVTMMNGTHIDSLGPETITRWLEFLDIFVADRVPSASPILDAVAPLVYSNATGGAPTDDAACGAIHERADGGGGKGRIRGTRPAGSGAVRLRRRQSRPRGSAGRIRGCILDLAARRDRHDATSSARTALFRRLRLTGHAEPSVSFKPDPSVRPATDLPSGNAWAAKPPYDWTVVPAANGIAFETPVFSTDTTIVGPASLDLRARVDCSGHRSAGDRHRGPSRRQTRRST